MDAKELLLEALNTDLPAGVLNFLLTECPAVDAISTPSDVESAIIAQGTFCANMNKYLAAFAGLTPIELFLRIGQKSSTLQEIALAGIVLAKDVKMHTFNVSSPQEGMVYSAGEQAFYIFIENGVDSVNAATVVLNENIYYPLAQHERVQNIYGTIQELDAGSYVADFRVQFRVDNGKNFVARKTVNFTVV